MNNPSRSSARGSDARARLLRRGASAGVVFLGVTCAPMACGGGSDGGGGGGVGLGTAGCLTDQQICQFQKGVSTQADVKNALGNAQEYIGSTTWIYVCQEVSGTQIVHNDMTIFTFDSSGRLTDIMVLRQGSGSTPPPNCLSGSDGAAGG